MPPWVGCPCTAPSLAGALSQISAVGGSARLPPPPIPPGMQAALSPPTHHTLWHTLNLGTTAATEGSLIGQHAVFGRLGQPRQAGHLRLVCPAVHSQVLRNLHGMRLVAPLLHGSMTMLLLPLPLPLQLPCLTGHAPSQRCGPLLLRHILKLAARWLQLLDDSMSCIQSTLWPPPSILYNTG